MSFGIETGAPRAMQRCRERTDNRVFVRFRGQDIDNIKNLADSPGPRALLPKLATSFLKRRYHPAVCHTGHALLGRHALGRFKQHPSGFFGELVRHMSL